MEDKKDDLIELEKVGFVKDKCVEKNLIYETDDDCLYSNLYPIKFTKDINIYEYAFKIEPEVHEENVILKIFRQASPLLFEKYGYYYRSGPTFFALKKVTKNEVFKTKIYNKGIFEYTLTVSESGHHSEIKKGQTSNFSEIDEKVIFLIIREILQANPNVHFDRDNLYLENRKQKVKGVKNYYVHDGYKISIQQAECGICLIIGVKYKIKGDFTVYDMLKEIDIDNLIGRRFIPFEGSRHQQIYEIDTDRNPMNTSRNYDSKSYTYYEYYKEVLGVEIKDKEQPLISVDNQKWYVPELCTMIGINDDDINDNKFMEIITKKTRINPDEKIKQIEKCLELFYDTTEKKTNPDLVEVKKKRLENLNSILNDKCNTSDKKRQQYGIEIEKLEKPIKPYYIRQPTFTNGINNKLTIKDINRVNPVGRSNMSTDNWICLYYIKAEKDSYKLLNGFIKCAKGYGLKFKNNDSNWIPMKSYKAKDWINTVEFELKKRNECKFVIFLLNRDTSELYSELKKHSLYERGYISQVIKSESIFRAMKSKKGPDSYFSKILLQINNKLGGFNYFLNIEPYIKERNIMLIGIDSSHIWSTRKKINCKKEQVLLW